MFSGFRATCLHVLKQRKLLELGKASALMPDPDLSLQRRKLDNCQAGQTDTSTGKPWAPSESELSLIPHSSQSTSEPPRRTLGSGTGKVRERDRHTMSAKEIVGSVYSAHADKAGFFGWASAPSHTFCIIRNNCMSLAYACSLPPTLPLPPKYLEYLPFFCFVLLFGGAHLPVLRVYSWQDLGYLMQCWGSNQGQPRQSQLQARQLLYYLSNP